MAKHNEVSLPDRWVVHGKDRTGADYRFPANGEAQASKADAEELLRRLVKGGASLTITRECWDGRRGRYVRVV